MEEEKRIDPNLPESTSAEPEETPAHESHPHGPAHPLADAVIGAAAGAPLGPIGAAIGGILGGLVGAVDDAEEDAEDEEDTPDGGAFLDSAQVRREPPAENR